MNLLNIFETLYVYQDQITHSELWEILDEISETDSLRISEWLYQNNTGLPHQVIEQMQGIHHWYREHHRFMTDTQRRWLLITTLNNWDKLTLNGRRYVT